MKCHLCKEDKVSEEFPFYAPSEKCDHALLHCLKCLTNEIRQHKRCSQCKTDVDSESKRYKEYMETLEFLFPKVQNVVYPGSPEGPSHIRVTNMTGECTNPVEYRPDMLVQALKEQVTADMKIPCDQQILLYNGIELKTTDSNSKRLKLKDYNVQPGSTIHLLVRLYEVPSELDEVIFDLSWGYPGNAPDYLDTTVFLYGGDTLLEIVDYRYNKRRDKSRYGSAVKHSGDDVDEFWKIGHHKIEVSMKSTPPEVDKLVFTLSSWNAPNISKFRNPALRFFDKKSPNAQLCSVAMDHAANSRAVIMCCLSKRKGRWEVFQLKQLSDGNVQDYAPLKNKISSLIRQGYIV